MRYFVVLIILFANNGYSQDQFSDVLEYSGRISVITETPLESHNRYTEISEILRHPHVDCALNERGHKVTWKINAGSLWLTSIQNNLCFHPPAKVPLSRVFPEKEEKIKAVWYSGIIEVQISELEFHSLIDSTRLQDRGKFNVKYKAQVFEVLSGELQSISNKVIVKKIRF